MPSGRGFARGEAVIGQSPEGASQPRQPWRLGEPWQAAAIQAVTLAAGFGLLALVQILSTALILLFLGIIIGQALDPPVVWLSRRMPRGIAIVLIYAAIALAIVLIFWLVLPSIFAQSVNFASSLPHLIRRLQSFITHLAPGHGSQIAHQLESQTGKLTGRLITLPLTVATVVVEIVIVIFFSLYWLLAAPAMHNFALSLVPPDKKPAADALFDEVGGMLGGYIRGDVIDALLIGTIAYVGMRIIGVPFAVVLGVITAAGDLIPLVGPTIAQFLASGVALTVSPTRALITLGFFLVLQQVDGNITLPTITRGIARIPPLLIVFGLVAGGLAGGVLGAIVAIPLFGAIRIVLIRVAVPVAMAWWDVPED